MESHLKFSQIFPLREQNFFYSLKTEIERVTNERRENIFCGTDNLNQRAKFN
jgi:hypothetical protein